ncbi:MAG: diacylglycerol kinase, partial [Burkholderiaceae bacterium]
MLKQALALAKRRLVSAFFYSLEGFSAAWHSEEAIKVEMALLPVFLGLAFYLTDDGISRALLVGVLLL